MPQRSQGPPQSPIFVIGAMRSGTTLVRLVLDSHDNIAIPQETGFMRLVQAQKFTPFWKWGDVWHEHLGLDEAQLDAELRDFYDGLFSRYAEAEGKRRWGEKTPWHLWHAQRMAQMWPQAVFVGVVRHPGGTVGSLTASWKSYTTSRGIRLWQRANLELVRQATVLADRIVLLRYEELVLSPESTLRELLRWLGEPWSPRVLQHHEVQPQRRGAGHVEGRTRTDEPIDPARVTKWTTGLSVADVRQVRRQTEALARFLGYSFEDAAALAPLVPAGSPRTRIVTGTEIGERVKSWPQPLGLDDPTPVPLAERRFDPRRLTLQPAAPRHRRAATTEQAPNGHGRRRRPPALRARALSRLRHMIVAAMGQR